MIKHFTTALLLTAAIALSQSQPARSEQRQVSPRFFELTKGQKICPEFDFCYRFKATIDVSDVNGYVKEYGLDEDRKKFVSQRRYAGEVINVDRLTKIDGVWYAEFGTSRTDCSHGWCPGFVDARYLR
jgi:hypothetical protein